MFIGWLVPNRGMERFFETSLQCQIFRNMILISFARYTRNANHVCNSGYNWRHKLLPFLLSELRSSSTSPRRPIRVSITLALSGFWSSPTYSKYIRPSLSACSETVDQGLKVHSWFTSTLRSPLPDLALQEGQLNIMSPGADFSWY